MSEREAGRAQADLLRDILAELRKLNQNVEKLMVTEKTSDNGGRTWETVGAALRTTR
jgi:hypothetical protein